MSWATGKARRYGLTRHGRHSDVSVGALHGDSGVRGVRTVPYSTRPTRKARILGCLRFATLRPVVARWCSLHRVAGRSSPSRLSLAIYSRDDRPVQDRCSPTIIYGQLVTANNSAAGSGGCRSSSCPIIAYLLATRRTAHWRTSDSLDRILGIAYGH